MKLPLFQTALKEFSLLQTKWKSILDPIISKPQATVILFQDIPIGVGQNVINHKLGKKLTGWRIVGINAAATFYDAQSINSMPELTLVLISDTACIIQLEVF